MSDEKFCRGGECCGSCPVPCCRMTRRDSAWPGAAVVLGVVAAVVLVLIFA